MRIGLLANPVLAASEGWRRERGFYAAMAVVAALTTFVGFAPTYYLQVSYGTRRVAYKLIRHSTQVSSFCGRFERWIPPPQTLRT